MTQRREAWVAAGDATELRSFDDAPREDAELGARRMRATKPPQVPRTALRQDAQERTYILEATGTGVRQHFVNELPDPSDTRFVALGPPRLLAASEQGDFAAEAWRAVEEAGLSRALVPEEAGGFGMPAGRQP